MRLVIIGGSDAGIQAGLRATERDPAVAVTVLVADRYPNYSVCGIPYHVAGEVADWHDLAHRSRADLAAAAWTCGCGTAPCGSTRPPNRSTAWTRPETCAGSATTSWSWRLGRCRHARRSGGWRSSGPTRASTPCTPSATPWRSPPASPAATPGRW
jgi:hypothetical protein